MKKEVAIFSFLVRVEIECLEYAKPWYWICTRKWSQGIWPGNTCSKKWANPRWQWL